MKRIALLSDGWKRFMTYAWVDGIMKRAGELGEEIQLYHFISHGNWSNDELHNVGEYNIFELPELEKMDGIVLDIINITDMSVQGELLNRLKGYQVPIVSIALGVDEFYHVGIDNRSAICELMRHLYEVHNCRSFVYAGGPKNNYENMQRRQGFLDSIREFGLRPEENPVWDGDFDFEHGVAYMQRLSEGRLPDAVICASDNIAAGLCAAAAQMGYSVPEDFKVTGFDDLDKAAFFKPQITTVSSNRESMGSACMDVLSKIWAGELVEREQLLATSSVYGESCGCPNNHSVDYREYAKNQIIWGIKHDEMDQRLMELEVELARRREFSEIFECASQYYEAMECDGVYFVVDKRLYEAKPDTIFCTKGYDWEGYVVARAVEKGRLLSLQTIRKLNSHMLANKESSSYTYAPIHFRQQAVGFVVLKDADFLYNNPNFYDIHAACVTALENRFKKKQLEQAALQLRDVYNKDQLTGIYNRIAFVEKMVPAFETFSTMGEKCAILFGDLNYFKKINDTYGHEAGDKALKNTAAVLRRHCPRNGYVCRYGGDEFVVLLPKGSRQSAEEYCRLVKEELEKAGLSISLGIELSDPAEHMDLYGYVERADKKMYIQKQRYR